jgi:hypothetical protein
LAGLIVLCLWLALPVRAQAQDYYMGRMFYYPYHYFPHNYWPIMSPPWPERPGEPYRRPPAYMAYPAFQEPHWRYEAFERHSYYRGFHFWLDAF